MNRARKSIIWKLNDADFSDLVKGSKKMKDIFDFFNVKDVGRNNQIVNKRILELGLDISHFSSRTESSAETRKVTKEIFISDWLVKNSLKRGKELKRYLTQFELLDYNCFKCRNSGEWQGHNLTLQLEHKNGVSNDNRLENLCFLCPNCHSQTDTYAGRNVKEKFSDEFILNLIPTVFNRKELFESLGYSISGAAYSRIKKLMEKNPHALFKVLPNGSDPSFFE